MLATVRPLPRHASSSSVRVAPRVARSPRGSLVVRAELNKGRSSFDDVATFIKKYDWTSTMMGSLLVTGFCWSHGQDPITALSITFSSTIIAVVANEVFFSNESSQ